MKLLSLHLRLDYVLDAHGYQPLLNLSVMPYLSVAKSINSYFAERFHRIIVLDMPMVMSLLVKAIVPLLPSKTRQKLFFARRDDPESLKPLYALCRDQDKCREPSFRAVFDAPERVSGPFRLRFACQDMRNMLETLLKMNGEAQRAVGTDFGLPRPARVVAGRPRDS